MAIQRRPWVIWVWRAAALLVALALSACVASSTPPRAVALRVLSAAVAVSPSSYPGSCGASQAFRYTATLTANSGSPGGTVHYLWRIGFTAVEADVTFAAGDTVRQVTQTVTTAVQPDAEPLLLSTIQTTTPNVVTSPQVAVRLPCTTSLEIVSADPMVSPSSGACGSQTFGFVAILTAPEGNPGGAVRYTWHFLDGSTQQGRVDLAPGQINVTVATAITYFVLSSHRPAALAPQGLPASLARPAPTLLPTPLITPRPTATRGPHPTPTPTRTPRPTPTPTTGPNGKPVHAGQIGVWLSIDAPNTLRTDTVAPTVDC